MSCKTILLFTVIHILNKIIQGNKVYHLNLQVACIMTMFSQVSPALNTVQEVNSDSRQINTG